MSGARLPEAVASLVEERVEGDALRENGAPITVQDDQRPAPSRREGDVDDEAALARDAVDGAYGGASANSGGSARDVHQRGNEKSPGHVANVASKGNGNGSINARKPTLHPLKLKSGDGKGNGERRRQAENKGSATSSFTTRRKAGGNDAHMHHNPKSSGEAKASTAIATSNKEKPNRRRRKDDNRAVTVRVKLGDAASHIWNRLPGNRDLRQLAASSNRRASTLVGSGVDAGRVAMNTVRDREWRREWRGIHLPPSKYYSGERDQERRKKTKEAEVRELPAPGENGAGHNNKAGGKIGKDNGAHSPPLPANDCTAPEEALYETLPPSSPTLSSGPSVPLYPLLAAFLLYHLLKHLLLKRVLTHHTRTQLSRIVRHRLKRGWRGALYGGDGRQFAVSREELAAQLGKLKRKKEERLQRENSAGGSCDDREGEGGGEGGGRDGGGGSGGGNERGNGGGRGPSDGSGGRSGDDTSSRGNEPSPSNVNHSAAHNAHDLSTVSDQTSFLQWMRRSEDLERAARRVEQLTSDLVCAKENALILREELSAQAGVKDESPAKGGANKCKWMKMAEELERAERYVDRLASDLCCAKERVAMLRESQEKDEDRSASGGEEGGSCDDRCPAGDGGDEDDGGADGSGRGGVAGGRSGGSSMKSSDGNASRESRKSSANNSSSGKENNYSTNSRSLATVAEGKHPSIEGNEILELALAKQKLEKLTTDLAHANERLAKVENEKADLLAQQETQLQSLARENQELTETNAILNESVLKLQEENDELDREMEHLVGEMEHHRHADEGGEDEEGEHGGESLEFDAGAGLSVLAESLTADPADVIVREAGEREALRATVEELRQNLARSREDVARLTRERDGAADDARGLSLELARARDENAGLLKQQQLRDRSFSYDLPPASAISFESQSSHHTIETYEAMRAERNLFRSQVEAVSARLKSHVSKLNEATLELAKVREEADAASKAFDEERAIYNQHVASNLEAVRNLEGELDQMRHKNGSLVANLDQAKAKNKHLDSELTNAIAKYEGMKTSFEASIRQSSEETDAMKEGMKSSDAQISGLKSQILTMAQERDRAEAKCFDLETQLAGTAAKFTAIETEQKECLRVLERLTNESDPKQVIGDQSMRSSSPTFERVASHAEQVCNLQGLLKAERQIVRDQSAAIVELKEQIARREAERDDARLELESERLVLDSLQSEQIELVTQFAKLKADGKGQSLKANSPVEHSERSDSTAGGTQGSIVTTESMYSRDDLIVGFNPRIRKDRLTVSFDEVVSSKVSAKQDLSGRRSPFIAAPQCQDGATVSSSVHAETIQGGSTSLPTSEADVPKGKATPAATPAKRSKASGLRRLLSRSDKKKPSKRSTAMPGAAVALAALSILSPSGAQAIELGDEVCITGYIMDRYCIEDAAGGIEGTLLDDRSVIALQNPEKHSYHCLLDVGVCYGSGFLALGEKDPATDRHCLGFRLEDTAAVLEAGRAAGKSGLCRTCTGGDGAPDYGYRATVKGTVNGLGDGSEGVGGAPSLTNITLGSAGCDGKDTVLPACVAGTSAGANLVSVSAMLVSAGASAFLLLQ